MTPKLLSAEEMEEILGHVADALGAGARAKVEAHIAALEADNAALAELVQSAAGRPGSHDACWACGWHGRHHADCRFGIASLSPHPGERLLPEHAKTVATLTLARDVACAMHEAAQKARAEEQAEHAKALVWAKQSAITVADARILSTALLPDSLSEEYSGPREREALGAGWAAGVNHALDTLRAMKEPES